MNFDPATVPSPCYLVDEARLRRNLAVIRSVIDRTGCKILLALKGFAMWRTFPVVREYLHGVTASAVNEARLGREEFGAEVHAYAPAYSEQDITELLPLVDHLVFNSVGQFHRYRDRVRAAGRSISMGLRVNPEYSEVAVELYNPCRKRSRLGVRLAELEGQDLDGLDGLHFHTLCEQNSDTLERTLGVVVDKFSRFFPRLKWVNFGGGHHISRPDYDVDRLCRTIDAFKQRFPLEVYLEPGEAIALNSGVLVASVLDLVENEVPIAILDTSATAHMPDVLEMPYRPEIVGAGKPGEKPHTYLLGGLTCLAGDDIGQYSFDQPLQIGDRLVFLDMAHYTMVKNSTFNGVRLPAIAFRRADGEIEVVREFGYEDFRNRLS
ncbi:MAG: carboxynorspermidine decarboxylase [Verrucomicrobiales bacterium]|nr:carboxynorspermidine decarboxylase [Verrucomicrobiales bacterium]